MEDEKKCEKHPDEWIAECFPCEQCMAEKLWERLAQSKGSISGGKGK